MVNPEHFEFQIVAWSVLFKIVHFTISVLSAFYIYGAEAR